jgi:hypothetical protein
MSYREAAKLAAGVIMLATTMATAAGPGPGEAGRGQRSAAAAGPNLTGADYVVLIWYGQDRPLETFQHQIYDVRKGEYTAAVDDWIKAVREKYPGYLVRVLPVHLARERGATEKLKVGSVIHRELLIAAAQSGVLLDAPLQIGPGPLTGQRQAPSVNRMPGLPQPDRSFLNSSPTPSIPVYPRTRVP